MSSNIEKIIGRPALLEQLAEECCELSQAALKMARKLRNENYTPKTMEEIDRDLTEETADVLLCINELLESNVVNNDSINNVTIMKKLRWETRLEQMRSK